MCCLYRLEKIRKDKVAITVPIFFKAIFSEKTFIDETYRRQPKCVVALLVVGKV